MSNLNTHSLVNLGNLLSKRHIEAKGLYLHYFDSLPSVNFISEVDGEKAYAALQQKYGDGAKTVFRYQWYKSKDKTYQFDQTFVLLEHCLIELGTDYCRLLHDGMHPEIVDELTSLMKANSAKARRAKPEINLIVRSDYGFELKTMEIKRNRLNLSLYYEDDFADVDRTIRRRLNRKKDKGIVLLHGAPGTGKTTYLRYLISRTNKRILFLSPSVAKEITNPDFIELLIEHPNSVLVIEDAESLIGDRSVSDNPAVSSLLNIADGLLADCLNVQIICSFNSPLATVDAALMRKGRLIARYEFKPLSAAKAQQLSDHLGFATRIDRAMSLAEITRQGDLDYSAQSRQRIGFRRETVT